MIIINGKIRDRKIRDKEIEKNIEVILKKIKKSGFDVSVNFVSETKVKLLNNQYRKKNKITDVLSFAAAEGRQIGESKELGDIFICLPQIVRQAKEHKISFKEELTRMLVHGVLHLAGYDHLKKNEECKMMKIQEVIVNILTTKNTKVRK
jgi:probable rRNA maturation factor